MTKQAAAGTRVGIVGLGYVGLPLAVAFAEAGVDVLGLDGQGMTGSVPANVDVL